MACGDDETGQTFPDAPANPDQAKLLQLINDARTAGHTCGSTNKPAVGTVTWNDTLAVVAKKHSQDMDNKNFFTHTGSDGSTVEERIIREGYLPDYYVENLLKGGETEEVAIEAWLNSTDHCNNLMDAGVAEIGIGTAGPYWTLVMAIH